MSANSDSNIAIFNVGDSRAIMSFNGGKTIKQITSSHRPYEDAEMERIFSNGGRIYRYYIILQIELVLNLENEELIYILLRIKMSTFKFKKCSIIAQIVMFLLDLGVSNLGA